MNDRLSGLAGLDQRSREIFRRLVETYLATGEPVGSRTISRVLPSSLSPASVRNIMADLEDAGLLFSPHTSAGRIPTEFGLRFFVDALLEVGPLSDNERLQISQQVSGSNRAGTREELLTKATSLLSGLSHCAGVVVAPKVNARLKHMEFVSLGPGKALTVLVGDDGSVENRAIDVPVGLSQPALQQAANYINAHCQGRTLPDAARFIADQIDHLRQELDELTARVVEAGIATWAGSSLPEDKTLIVRGRANLIDDQTALADLERIRQLFDDLESKNDLVRLLGAAESGEGVRIFIGSENKLFSMSGSSVIVAPYRDSEERIVGVLGVIGPTRLNYARIIPMVDYTAKLIGQLLT
jgi:heat-inducible transcriptional repressor